MLSTHPVPSASCRLNHLHTHRTPAARTLRTAAIAMLLLGLASLSSLSSTAWAQGAAASAASSVNSAPSPAWRQAMAQFQQAAGGDDSAVDGALQALNPLVAAHPGHPTLMAYHGAAVSMQARASWLPWRKMSLAEDGLAEIDKALSLLGPAHTTQLFEGTPVALETRFVAANTFLKLPSIFHRKERGLALLAQVQSSPQLAQASLGLRGAVWMFSAHTALEAGQKAQARQWLTQVIAAQAPQAAQARTLMQEASK